MGGRPLADLRVVDLERGAVGRLLGELGAEIVHAVALIGTADVLIETGEQGLDPAALHVQHPALVILSATPFGTGTRYDAWQATDPVLHALSGSLSRSGLPGRAPLLPPGELALACAAAQAAFVVLLACVHRRRSGCGAHLDFSLLEAASQALDPGYGIAGSASAGVAPDQLPRGRVEARHLYPIIACRDGHVRICVLSPRQWRGMFDWLGRPPAFADPSFATLHVRFASAELVPAIAAHFAGRTRAELEAEGQRHGVPTAALMRLDEALASEQVLARAAMRTISTAPGAVARVPDGMIEIDGVRMGARDPSPEPEDGWDLAPMPARRPESPPAPAVAGTRPLSGLRVLDFGVIVVGAEQGRLLADQGADVIKVESTAFPDGSRQSKAGGMAPTFAAGHFNKRSLGIDLRDPEGRALLLRLVAQTDIVLSNFKPGTLASLGLDAASLRALNPGLIMVDSSAFGPTGPWRERLGYGPLVRAASGLTEQWRYPDDPESFCDGSTVYPDHAAARIGAVAALALLLRRDRTGLGGAASIAQNEVMLGHMARHIAALDSGGPPAPQDAPWGVFACAGEDEWCVVTVRHDEDFSQLCTAIGRADLAADPALSTRAGRDAARARIDAAVGGFTARHGPVQVMEVLQAAGVPAGAMLRVSELPGFPYFVQRGAFRLVSHPHLPTPFFREAAPVRCASLPDPPDRPAPLLGEHTMEIARERLGLDDAEIARLLAVGILEAPTKGHA